MGQNLAQEPLADLGLTHGFKPHEGDEKRDELIQYVLDKCIEHDVPWGMFTSTFDKAEKWLARGGKIATVGTEMGFMAAGMSETESQVKSLLESVNG